VAERSVKKQELETILGDGENTPDLGPIEDYLHAVATERKLPDFAVGMCTLRIEEAAPKLRAVLRRAADGEVLSDDESLLLFRGLHILGGARDREACQPLLRLLRRPFDEVDALLGSAITESLAKIVTGVFDDDIDALFALIIDGSTNEFIREALFGAATFLTWERRIERDRFREFLVRFYEERPAEDNDAPWAGWVQAIALLGLRDLVPLAHSAFSEGRICGPATPKTSSTTKPRGLISRIRASRSDVTIHVLAGAARRPKNAALPTASRRCDTGRPSVQCAVIQARASRCAVAISASDIIAATSRRIEMASARPFSAARLNHLWAATRFTTPERPLAQYRPRSNSTSGIAVASTAMAASRSICP
jgi:hypothetical protein